MRHHVRYGSYPDKTRDLLQTGAGVRRERAYIVIILLLLAAVVTLGVLGGRAMAYRSDVRELFRTTILEEANKAVSVSGALSRTSGSNTSSQLGQIRANVHAMETINSFQGAMENGRYDVPEETFSQLYDILDRYSERLKNGGVNTADLQGELQAALEALQLLVAAL